MKTRVVHVNDGTEGAVYIGRSNNRRDLRPSIFGNPFHIGKLGDRAEVVSQYRELMEQRIQGNAGWCQLLIELRGNPLACWCRHDGEKRTEANACHGDVLVSLLEQYTDEELKAMATR